MNKPCEKYRKLLLDQIIQVESTKTIRPDHPNHCADCKKFELQIRKIHYELQLLASDFNNDFPKVDLTENVLDRIKDLHRAISVVTQTLEREDTISEFTYWDAYICNEADDITKYRCETKLSQSPQLQEEIQTLKETHQLLIELGEDYSNFSLQEDLTSSILSRIKSLSVNSEDPSLIEEIEKDLFELSEILSATQGKSRAHDDVRTHALKLRQNKKAPHQPTSTYLNILKFPNSPTIKKLLSNAREYMLPIAVSVMLVFTIIGLFISFNTNTNRTMFLSFTTKIEENSQKGFKTPSTPALTSSTEEENYKTIDLDKNDKEVQFMQQVTDKKNPRKNFIDGTLHQWLAQLKDNALVNAGKLMRMGVWMTLSPEEAKDLLQQSGLSPEAILGAVQFLPPQEAKVVLQAAIDNNPNDAYLRFAMVQTLKRISKEVPQEEIENHLLAWKQLDPSNSLPYYVEAELDLEKGDVQKALGNLQSANNTPGYNAFAQITAKAYMESLLAKGIEPELAKLLASASMGLRELQELNEIVQNLTEYGKYYEEIGDYQTALMIYDALRNLGLKIEWSSELLQEKLAGIKYTQEAINATVRLLGMWNKLDDAQSLIDFTKTIGDMIINYTLALENFYRLFDTNNTEEVLELINTYLNHGNANLNIANVDTNPQNYTPTVLPTNSSPLK